MVMDTLTIVAFVVLLIYKSLLMISSKFGGGIVQSYFFWRHCSVGLLYRPYHRSQRD